MLLFISIYLCVCACMHIIILNSYVWDSCSTARVITSQPRMFLALRWDHLSTLAEHAHNVTHLSPMNVVQVESLKLPPMSYYECHNLEAFSGVLQFQFLL